MSKPIDRLRQEVIDAARTFAPASPRLRDALDRLDRAEAQPTKEAYEAAVREWVARRLRHRGHKYTLNDVRNVRFGVEEGWPGTEVTAGEPDYAAIRCELLVRGKWTPHAEAIEDISSAAIVQECAAIYEELLGK